MGYKVKSTGIPWRISEGPLMKMAVDVVFTLNGTDEVPLTVTGTGVNVKDLDEATWLAQVRMNLKTAIVAQCQALDAAIVETAAMTNQKTLLQTALTSSNWWFVALLLMCLLWFTPQANAAGDLVPSWTTYTTANSGTSVTVAGQNGNASLGTIDMTGYYVCEVVVIWEETGDNPAGTAGVSVFAGSGVTGYAPTISTEITPTDYSANYARLPACSGVSKVFIIENIPTISVVAGKGAVDQDTFKMRYRRMKGTYN